jgi:hypothetical protein
MTISKDVLDELLSGVENANDLLGDLKCRSVNWLRRLG